MISIVKILETSLEGALRIVKSLRYGKVDGKRSFEVSPFGIDSNVPDGYKAVYLETGLSGKSVIVGYINVDQIAEKGGIRLYSKNGSNVTGDIYIRSGGDIELNGNSDYLVRFSALETAFNQLRDSYNSHIHNYVVGSGTTAPTSSQSAASVSGAKVDNLRTN